MRQLPVRVLTRDAVRARDLLGDSVDIVVGDVRKPEAVERAVAGATTVISAMHGFAGPGATSPEAVDRQGNLNLIGAARAIGVDHFVLMSIQGVTPAHPIELFRMKFLAEETLLRSGIGWTILRPTAFMELWAMLVVGPLLESGKTKIFGSGKNPINFVSVHDVARFVELAVIDPSMRGATVEIGGPENLTFDQVVEIAQRETGKRGSVSHVPLPVMRLASALMRPFNPIVARQIQAGVVMDTTDMRFDASGLRRTYPSIPLTTLAEVIRRDFAAK